MRGAFARPARLNFSNLRAVGTSDEHTFSPLIRAPRPSARSCLTQRCNLRPRAQKNFPSIFPQSGWVEHDPKDLWATTAGTCRKVIERAGIDAKDITAIGITNQRETTVVWDRKTGEPVYNAIVWQDRRTAEFCRNLREAGHGYVHRSHRAVAGPLFFRTKLKWILDHVEGARDAAARGELLFGTVDSYLIWKLTGGQGTRHGCHQCRAHDAL